MTPTIGSPAAWAIFSGIVIVLLVLDLAVLHRRARSVSIREAALITVALVIMAALFALGLRVYRGHEAALQFITGYVVEEALSVDNLFVFLLIFDRFRIPAALQHRVLFWGIFGALAMRGIFIAVGVALVSLFHWVFYLFGVFLVFTGIKLLIQRDDAAAPDDTMPVRLYKRLVPMTPNLVGSAFFTRQDGRWVTTPLLLVLFIVEISDIVFAVDSIPATFAVTTDPFLVYTSNVFAIMGLRSLFFLLAHMLNRFHLLKYGLALVLVFIGAKMLLADFYTVSSGLSLGIIGSLLALAVLASALLPVKKDAESGGTP